MKIKLFEAYFTDKISYELVDPDQMSKFNNTHTSEKITTDDVWNIGKNIFKSELKKLHVNNSILPYSITGFYEFSFLSIYKYADEWWCVYEEFEEDGEEMENLYICDSLSGLKDLFS